MLNVGVVIFLNGCVRSMEQALKQQFRYSCATTLYCTYNSCLSQDGCQPIHFAASNGEVEVVRLLVQKYSADPNMPTVVSIYM